jgi:hypothetical protein
VGFRSASRAHDERDDAAANATDFGRERTVRSGRRIDRIVWLNV